MGKDVLHFLALGSRLELDILLESMKTKTTNIILSKHVEVEICYQIVKAATYDERPKMKRDARLKAVFFPRTRQLSVGRLSSFSGVCCTLRL